MDMLLKSKVVQAASADLFDGDPETTALDMSDANSVRFAIPKTATAGSAVITAQYCDSDGSNPTAIVFEYRETDDGVRGDLTRAAVTGFTTAVGSTLVEVFINAQALGAKKYVRLVLTEAVNTPVVGVVMADVLGRSS